MASFFSNIHKWKKQVYTAAGIILGFTSLPHLFPSLIQQSCEAKDVTVPIELQLHVEKIASAMNIAKPHRIKVFINNGISNVSGGNTLLPYGAVVGLSKTVLFENLSDIEDSGLTWNGRPIDCRSHDDHMLAELLIPTAQEINFSIAHELSHIQHLDFVWRSLLPSATLIVMYHLACFFYPIRNLSVGVTMVIGIGLLFYYIPFALCRWQEYRADKRAGYCGHSYSEGGITKMKKRITMDKYFGRKSKFSFPGNSSFEVYPPNEDRLSKLEEIHSKQKQQWSKY